MTSFSSLIICCQVIPSKEIPRALDIAILHPPSHKTVKDTPSKIYSLLSNLVHYKVPPYQLPLALLAGHHPACVGHPVTGHALT